MSEPEDMRGAVAFVMVCVCLLGAAVSFGIYFQMLSLALGIFFAVFAALFLKMMCTQFLASIKKDVAAKIPEPRAQNSEPQR